MSHNTYFTTLSLFFQMVEYMATFQKAPRIADNGEIWRKYGGIGKLESLGGCGKLFFKK